MPRNDELHDSICSSENYCVDKRTLVDNHNDPLLTKHAGEKLDNFASHSSLHCAKEAKRSPYKDKKSPGRTVFRFLNLDSVCGRLAVFVTCVHHVILSHIENHTFCASIRPEVLNSASKNGKQKDEAQGDDSLSLGYGDGLFGKVSRRLFTSNGITPTRFQFKTSRRVSSFSPKGYVSGGTSPQTRTSDPSKCCTRLWTQLAALYGAYGLCETDAINRLTGRLVLDNGHGKVNGDLILCSSTAWYSSGYRELRKADYCRKEAK